ncbi:MAG: hypothetical protein HRU15_18715 [Planctomycetes bacterium]|nr:hypothetical protein [Planctomycetota bacterium]
MSKPVVYIHRVQWCPADDYMYQSNWELLHSFAEVRDSRNATEAATHEEMVQRLKGADAVLVLNGSCGEEITADALHEAESVRTIAVTHWYSPELHQACSEAEVELQDITEPCSQAVAEWSLGSIINGLRKTDYFDREIKKGNYPPWKGTAGQLNGSRVGIVGSGRIGCRLISYLAPFDVEVVVFDPFMSDERAGELGVQKLELNDLMSSCDAVALHAPNLPATENMIGAEQLKLMKDGALLVNGARSFLIDSDAFREEISTGRIRAALDVFDNEPFEESERYLCELDNVILTPHIAGTTELMFKRCAQMAIEAIRDSLLKQGVTT